MAATATIELSRQRSAAAAAAAKRRKVFEWIAIHSLAIALALLFVLPFVFLFLESVMTDQQAGTSAIIPTHWAWHNYVDVFHKGNFLDWWKNSIVYAVLGTVFTVVSSVPVAFAMAKYRYRGRKLQLMLVISAMMIPPQVTVIPLFLIWSKQFHLTGTVWPLVIPMLFGDAYSIFLLRQFLLTVPKEYMDAAKVDGCSEVKTLLRVVVPMIRPAIAAVALFQFFYCWNDYFGPLIYDDSGDPKGYTLSLGLETFKSAHHVDWNLMMTANLLVIAPVVIIFFFAQRAFIEGVTLTGVKG